jgi:hypothetical protein
MFIFRFYCVFCWFPGLCLGLKEAKQRRWCFCTVRTYGWAATEHKFSMSFSICLCRLKVLCGLLIEIKMFCILKGYVDRLNPKTILSLFFLLWRGICAISSNCIFAYLVCCKFYVPSSLLAASSYNCSTGHNGSSPCRSVTRLKHFAKHLPTNADPRDLSKVGCQVWNARICAGNYRLVSSWLQAGFWTSRGWQSESFVTLLVILVYHGWSAFCTLHKQKGEGLDDNVACKLFYGPLVRGCLPLSFKRPFLHLVQMGSIDMWQHGVHEACHRRPLTHMVGMEKLCYTAAHCVTQLSIVLQPLVVLQLHIVLQLQLLTFCFISFLNLRSNNN